MPVTLTFRRFRGRPRAFLRLMAIGATLGCGWSSGPLSAQSLQGSPASLDRQNHQAHAHDFTYLRTPQQVRDFVDSGYLVRVSANADLDLHQVSFPYARPEARVFVERLASQYRAACGERLVVTSLTRPLSNQPHNASDRSVHPTGMAVDLRRSNIARCRQWLESTLLSLEATGVIEATRENNPPHYHIAVYPQPYIQYVADRTGNAALLAQVASASNSESATSNSAVQSASLSPAPEPSGGTLSHRVARGESLWTIARLYGVTEGALRIANGLSGSRILAGQVLSVPADAAAPSEAVRYTVQRGDSLWVIASRVGTTVEEIRRRNGMGSTRIYAGQVLDVPVTR